MSAVQRFEFEGEGLRSETIDGEPWFIASDVAKLLGYRDAATLTRRLDGEDLRTRSVCTKVGFREMTAISEAGLFTAILGSQVEGARRFKRRALAGGVGMSPWMKFADGGDGQVPAVITRSPSPVTPAAEVEIVVDAGATDETRGHRVFIDGKLSYFDPSPRGSWSLGPSDALELLDGIDGQFESVGEDAYLVLKFADGIRGRLVLDVPTRRNERGVHGEDVEALVHDDTGAAEVLHDASPSVGAPDGAGTGTPDPTVGEKPSEGSPSPLPPDGTPASADTGEAASA